MAKTSLSPQLREHLFLGMTQSLCPQCLKLVSAKIISQDSRVYFEKFCPEHGLRRDFVCSDVSWWDRLEFNVPGREPVQFGVQPERGCPFDCGLCTLHEQHTCIAVLEINSACNLTCPMCYASSAPGGSHLPFEECQRAIDRLVQVEGRAEILQLSGGEPTIHPRFLEVFEYACRANIEWVMINTNGIRLANDRALCEALARRGSRCHIYLQLDGLHEHAQDSLRGVPLLEVKLRAVELLGEYGLNTTLVATMQPGINEDQIGPLIDFARQRSWITGVSFQPACYVGRHVRPADLEQRVTFPDVIRGAERQTAGLFTERDFFPVPCAHPNSHTLAYAFRKNGHVVPITRFVEVNRHFDLLANGISLTRENTRQIVARLLERETCGPNCSCFSDLEGLASQLPLVSLEAAPRRGQARVATGDREVVRSDPLEPGALDSFTELAREFFRRALNEELAAGDMFRITVTSFMDAYTFDIRQIIKSCVHHLLPSGHLIPFCAYNLLYRDGRVPLPPLESRGSAMSRETMPENRFALPILKGER